MSGSRKSSVDKRRALRIKKRVMIRYGENKADRAAFTMNVSEGGAQLKTNHVYQPGTTLLVELTAGDRIFTMWAKVRWARRVPPQLAHVLSCGMGLQFIDPPEEWRTFFRESATGAQGAD